MKELDKSDFYVSKELIIVPSDNRHSKRVVRVTKVGRLYITLNAGYRIEISELNVRLYGTKDYTGQGRFFISEEEYEEAKATQKAVRELNSVTSNAGLISSEKSLIKAIEIIEEYKSRV